MFPVLIIAIGIVVLALGKRLAVMGAAIGALLGVALLTLLGPSEVWVALAIPAGLAVAGFFVAGFAKAIVKIVLLVMGALAGALIVMGFLDLLKVPSGGLYWLLAVVGGVVGLILVRRYEGPALIVFSGLIGGLLVVRGLSDWLPSLKDGALGTLIVIVLAGLSIAYQGGFLARRNAPPTDGQSTPPAP
jgi:hypothetical protein